MNLQNLTIAAAPVKQVSGDGPAVSARLSASEPAEMKFFISSMGSGATFPFPATGLSPVEPFGLGMRINPQAMRVNAFYPAPLAGKTVYVRQKEDGSISLYDLRIIKR